MVSHDMYMHRCLQLARLGEGYVAPNPMVGAVLVHEDRIIGEGWHAYYGGPHAEVNCFDSVPLQHRHLIPGASLYVSLEPCNHFGKTPPCSLRILKEGVKKVVVGCSDPFEAVNGTGIATLRAAGVEVVTPVLYDQCRQLNAPFFTFHTAKRPYITLKWAETMDGFIAAEQGAPLQISGPLARRWVHKLRSSRAAIMVGTHTARVDNPVLDNRFWWGKAPMRIITDTNATLPADLRLFKDSQPLWVFSAAPADRFPAKCTVILVPSGASPTPAFMAGQLYKLGIQSVLVEGGTAMLQSFLDAHLWDELFIIRSRIVRSYTGVQAPLVKKMVPDAINYLGTDGIERYNNAAAPYAGS